MQYVDPRDRAHYGLGPIQERSVKSERLDKQMRPKRYTPFTFAWLRAYNPANPNDPKEVPILITRVDGNDVYYRTVRLSKGLGQEQVTVAKDYRLRPASRSEFHFVIKKGPKS